MASRWLLEFTEWMKLKGYTRNSINCYSIRLRAIDAWLKAQGWEPTRLADPEVLRLYLQGVDASRQTPLGKPSRQLIANAVSCWLRYARKLGLLPPAPIVARPSVLDNTLLQDDWQGDFLRWLQANGYSRQHTMENYRRRLQAIDAWLKIRGWEPARLADPEVLGEYEHYLASIRPTPLGKPSWQTIEATVTCWLSYARKTGLLPAQPPSAGGARPVQTQPWLAPFEEHLRRAGYRRGTIMDYLNALESVAHFLSHRGLEPAQLADPATQDLYLREWENARQPRPNPGSRAKIIRAISRWLTFAGLAEASARPILPAVIEDFLQFLREHRGLGASSLRDYSHSLTALVQFVVDQGHADPVGIPLGTLDAFVSHGRKTRTNVARAARAVRGLLRYLFLVGLEPTDRSNWVDTPRMYRNERLPRHLSDTQLEQALAQVDRQSEHGKKLWAMLMLLTNYGLRIGEAGALRLEDLNWEAGWLRVTRGKTNQTCVYPITPAVEEAVKDYLKVRPLSTHPELFLTGKAPYRPYSRAPQELVRTVLTPVMGNRGQGAHALRHTLARRLREGGVSLPLMRQILGHRASNSTGRYLRIALDELREVADNYGDLL